MTTLPDFRLETHFSKWEFKARYHLTASDAESMSLPDLLGLATPEDRTAFEGMWLGYTETHGAPDLRAAIAQPYEAQTAEQILCFAGASEGIFAANSVLLDKHSHAIVVTPNYQSHETLAGVRQRCIAAKKSVVRRAHSEVSGPMIVRRTEPTIAT